MDNRYEVKRKMVEKEESGLENKSGGNALKVGGRKKAVVQGAADVAEKKVNDVDIEEKDFSKLNLDERVTVRNLANWDVTFSRKHDGVGAVVIAANGQYRLTRNEIQAQVNDNNKLFTGTDGRGTHATLIIQDKDTRMWLEFETADRPQGILTDKIVTEIFTSPWNTFEKKLREYVMTMAEKNFLMESIKRLNLNDHRKIVACEEYTGYKI